ncbi:hypothetical protein EDC04DRAFT_2569387, partial [Pisolithus marmoratus]
LPLFWKALPLPESPFSYLPFQPPHLSRFARSPPVSTLMENLRKDIRCLTNEDGMSDIASKHSFPGGSKVAVKWLKTKFEVTDAACRFTPPMSSGKISTRYNATRRILVLCSYDSLGSFGVERVSTRCNDDASGTISILSIARWMKQPGTTFRSNVELVALAAKKRMYWDDRHTLACFIDFWMVCQEFTLMIRKENYTRVRISRMAQADIQTYHTPNKCSQVG